MSIQRYRSNRCAPCDIDWPKGTDPCGVCNEPTFECELSPISNEDAGKHRQAARQSRKNHEQFEKHYEELCVRELQLELSSWQFAKLDETATK